MIILPAIDIKDGNCVRLLRGDYATAQKVAEDAVKTAQSFQASGATWLHVVDLDGAKAKEPVNQGIILKIFNNCNLKIEVGGGIRNIETIDYYLSKGISRVILGSSALQNPSFVEVATKKYGDAIAVGIDAIDGKVAAEGWTSTSKINYLDMAKHMEAIGVQTIIFTDISRDGTLLGPNIEMLLQINQTVSCNIIASGGVSGIKDIKDLKILELYGVICGKAIYSGNLDLREAISIGKEAN